MEVDKASVVPPSEGLRQYYITKIEDLMLTVSEKNQNLRRLQAQRNELNAKVRMLREELQLLQEQGNTWFMLLQSGISLRQASRKTKVNTNRLMNNHKNVISYH